DGLALPEELGIAGHDEPSAAGPGPLQQPAHDPGGTDRKRRFVHDGRTGPRTGPTSSAAATTAERSALPSAAAGDGTQTKTMSAWRVASAAPTTNVSRPEASPSCTSRSSPRS